MFIITKIAFVLVGTMLLMNGNSIKDNREEETPIPMVLVDEGISDEEWERIIHYNVPFKGASIKEVNDLYNKDDKTKRIKEINRIDENETTFKGGTLVKILTNDIQPKKTIFDQ